MGSYGIAGAVMIIGIVAQGNSRISKVVPAALLLLSADVPAVVQSDIAVPAAVPLLLSGDVPTVTIFSNTMQPAAGSLVLSSSAPSLDFSYSDAPASASFALTGVAPTLTIDTHTTTWDAGTVSSNTLSGGNLIATNTDQSVFGGAHAPSSAGKTSGKLYFEIATTTVQSSPGSNVGFGIGTTGSSYNGMASGTTGCWFQGTGAIYANGSFTGSSLSASASGDVFGLAVDLDNLKFWIKKVSGTPGNWNGSGAANPATNTGGITIPSGTMVPFLVTGGGSGGNPVHTLNAGASAFTGTVPSGFTSGWAS